MWTIGPGSVRVSVRGVRTGPLRLDGSVSLRTDDGTRSFDAALHGEIEFVASELQRFDLVARGAFAGAGTWTATSCPAGRFTLAIALELAAPGAAPAVPPQGARDLAPYLAPEPPRHLAPR